MNTLPRPPKNSGLILDDLALIESLPQFEEVFGAGEPSKPTHWYEHMPGFRNQGASVFCTAYAGVNIASALNHKETGVHEVFSPFELFYRTNGSVWGNTLMNAAIGMKETLVSERDVPTPMPALWNQSVHNKFRDQAKATPEQIEAGKKYAVGSAVFVSPSPTMLRRALEMSPLMLAIGLGSNYWNTPAPRRNEYGAYHAVALCGMTERGEYEIFESLQPRGGWDGQHSLAADYEILYALAFTDLPNDWYEKQNAKKTATFEFALMQYGKRRVLSLEQSAALKMSAELAKHSLLRPYAGKIWTVIVNALAYGGYTTTDLLNHLTSIRRGKGPIFDLNKPR